MKPATFLVSALATLVAAAPTTSTTTEVEKRLAFDAGLFNGLNNFNQVNLNYLLNVNSLDLQLLGLLAQQNNLNILQFQGLFQQNNFDLASLLQFQQLQLLLDLGGAGVFNGLDLNTLNFGLLNFGLLDNFRGIDLQQFIVPSVVTQVQTVASQSE